MSKKMQIRNGTIFDGKSGTVSKNEVIEIENEVITYVGPQRDCKGEFEIVDATGKFIMPGIIDCHIHLCGILKEDALSRLLEPNMQQAMVSVKQAEKVLCYGVTTVCDVSMAGPYLKRLIDSDVLQGPRIIACGQGLSMGGGGPYVDPDGLFPLDYIKANHPWGIPCDGEDNLRHQIRDLQRKGCEAIKVWATGGGLQRLPFDTDRIYNDKELFAICEEAKMDGMVVLAHCESLEGTKAALRNGIKCILHGVELDKECCQLINEKKAWLMPTFNINLDWVENYTDDELRRRKNIFENNGESLQKKEYNRILNNFKTAYEKDVQIALASDTYCEEATPYGEYTHREIKSFVNLAGVPAAEALLAATRYAAEALQMDHCIGSIERGKIADILFFDKNIVDNIDFLIKENLSLIMKNGQIIKGLK